MREPSIHYGAEATTTSDLIVVLEECRTHPRIAEINARISAFDIAYNLGPSITHTQTATVEVMITEDIECGVTKKNIHYEGI